MVETGGTSPGLLLGALIFLIVLAVAIFVATLAYFGRAQSKQQIKQEKPVPPAPPQEEDEPSSPARSSAPETPARPGEVMRVIRDEQTGRVLVEVEGRQYTHIREIEDAHVGRRVLWAIADLLRFTGGMAANPQAVRSAAQQVAQNGQTPAAPRTAPVGQEPLQTTALPASPSTSTTGARYSMLEFFRRGLETPPTALQPGPRSFIEEIEAILQENVRRRETPLSCEVHVATGPDDRLQIRVGQDIYGSPDEIPDPEVQALIRAAVEEWEGR